ncbi:hypothetical protein HYV11_03725 [Candidatus Dependentiae bacterium]|nr:hypothetical protein [Candidatus Dependentiae bacterium]
MNFKNHKLGFAFIEVMIAVMLLALFGTQLFFSQSTIFSKITKMHAKIMTVLRLQSILPEINIQKLNLLKQKKSLQELSLKKDFSYPSQTIVFNIKKISDKSELFKKFNKTLRMVEQTVTEYDLVKEKAISFLYVPLVVTEESAKETKT